MNKHEGVRLKHHSDSEAFIEYSNDMDNAYENLKKNNRKKGTQNND